MNIFLDSLRSIEQSLFFKKNKREIVADILRKHTHQSEVLFEIRDTKLILKVHPLVKQHILLKKRIIIYECAKKSIIVHTIV